MVTLVDSKVPNSEITNVYGALFKEIIMGMMKLSQYDDSVFLDLNRTKSKNIKDMGLYKETSQFRKAIKIFFYDVTQIFGFRFFYFDILLPEISLTINEIKKDINNISVWGKLESEIFTFESICRCANQKEDLSFLDTLFDTFFEIPENLLQIKKKVTDVIDELGNSLSSRPIILLKGFNYLLSGLENEIISSKINHLNILEHCSISLRNLLTDNRKVMYNNKEDLFKSIFYT